MTEQRVAIVHEWLVNYAGSERVLRELLAIFPEADLFSVVDFLSDDDRDRIFGKRARTTFIQSLPLAKSRYKAYLPLMPLAIEQLDLSSYDLIISNSHAVAKGVLTGPLQRHITYCHTPIRYAWDMQHQYLRESGLEKGITSLLVRMILHYIRQWDLRSSVSVDQFITNSNFVASRIRKLYGRNAIVINPPVDVDAFSIKCEKEDFYLAASRLVPYKRMDLIAAAFGQMPDKHLVIIGDGPGMARLRASAGPNVTILGYQSDEVLRNYMQRARAFVFAAEEDFGITPVEAQACGTPVIAFERGGAKETIIAPDNAMGHPPTGLFFQKQTTNSLIAAVKQFEQLQFDPRACRQRAETFNAERFRRAIKNVILPETIYHTKQDINTKYSYPPQANQYVDAQIKESAFPD